MRKYAALLLTIVLMVFVTGCGGNTSNVAATTLPAVTPIALTVAEVSGKTLYSTSSNGYIAYQLDALASGSVIGAARWNSVPNQADDAPVLDTNGTWSLSTDGMLVLSVVSATGTVTETNQFKRLQTESTYWLVSDKAHNNTITRFYFGASDAVAQTSTRDSARAYLTSITKTSGVLMGGTVQGGAIAAKFSSYSVSTFAGTAGVVGLAGGTGAAASFNHPTGITTDGTNFYVTDYLNNTIRKIDKNRVVTTLSLVNSSGAVSLNHPTDVTCDGSYLYVVDSWNHCIRQIDIFTTPDSTIRTVTATIGSVSALAGAVDSTVVTDVRFNTPTGITTDGTNLYVTDSGNHTIRKIVISSFAVSTLAGSAGNSGSADSTTGGAVARFYLPVRLTTDGSNLYVTDFNNRTVRQIVIATGNVTTIAGKADTAPSLDDADAIGPDARFNQPNGITTDGANLYVTDSYNYTIRKIVISSKSVTLIAGIAGTAGSADTAAVVTATLKTPVGITTDGTSLFVVDSNNNTIRRIK